MGRDSMTQELVDIQRDELKKDLGVIRVYEGKDYGFKFDLVFNSEQEAKHIFNKIPKSYKVRLSTLGYPHLNIRKPMLNVSISFVPNESTGRVNEAGRSRATKTKEKLKELLPHHRVITTVLVPVPEHRGGFRQLTTFEGWSK